MYRHENRLHFSPSDLTRFMESPFAVWMSRCKIEDPDNCPKQDEDDDLQKLLQVKGYAHEDELEESLSNSGETVISIDGDTNHDKFTNTLNAMKDGTDVIVQARLEQDDFAGFADFLMKVPGGSDLGDYHYEVWDTKLSTTLKPTFIMQLCCYAEMLEKMQGRRPSNITVALGNGEKSVLKVKDYFDYYGKLKEEFLKAQEYFDIHSKPDPAESKSWGKWSDHANEILIARDHLFQVATISKSQIKKLEAVGITTMNELAKAKETCVKGVGDVVLSRLINQAALQVSSRGKQTPDFKIIAPEPGKIEGLAMLPPHSANDVYFDMEGYPFVKGGLEYLWGATYFDDQGNRTFRDFWAHNEEQEKSAFCDFIDWVYTLWKQDSSMHIYHYANYEIEACRRLMGRYGLREHEVDQLLRNEVFVDLYKVVKGSLLLGEPRYSIKNVERLYRPQRDTAVGDGASSITVYEAWTIEYAKGATQGPTWQTSSILKDIRDYNIDDCNSTQELAKWLRTQQAVHKIAYIGTGEADEPEISETITDRIELRNRLLDRAKQESLSGKFEDSKLTENLAWALEFHRREAKPVFWRLFDRLGLKPFELEDDLDCLAGCLRTDRAPFKPKPKSRNYAYEYRFDSTQEFKGAARSFYLLGKKTEDGNNVKVTYVGEESDLENGIICLQSKNDLPETSTLIPDEFVSPDPIPESIDKLVQEYDRGKLTRCAILDFLARAQPRIKGYQGGPIVSAEQPHEQLQEIIDVVKNLDSSYLTIQGPPGCGKTHTGKHIIAELVKNGAKVGISSNSHKAINNLLISTARLCAAENIQANFVCTRDTEPAIEEMGIQVVPNNSLSGQIHSGCVIGTTAWGFARAELENQFDYLFVDEAGQVSVANLIAISRSANNLILLGDQMQLGQPSQGSHPAESGLSILDYLLHDDPTIREDMGVFLGITYRMHPLVNRFISDHIYDGKLETAPANVKRVVLVPESNIGLIDIEAGIKYIPVNHEGNTQASDEEIEVIQKIAQSLIGRTHVALENEVEVRKPLSWDDILFVAPYNHQVSKLRKALDGRARIGTVDKFQGQEAPIVILSMCTSDANESARGVDFLFDRKRLNVAISRAQSIAIVVGNPKLALTHVNSADQLKKVNLISALF